MQQYVTSATEFVKWAAPILGIKGPVRLRLLKSPLVQANQRSFGSFDAHTKAIVVCCGGRHPLDVLRTLAHELVHHAQSQGRDLTQQDGATGSDVENQANAVAGILMRWWNQR